MRKKEESSVAPKVDVLLGLQWGDEGKGKVIDLLLPDYAAVARFGGGANAGHTLKHKGMEFIGHLMPSGVFGEQILLQGPGMVIHPVQQMCEIDTLLGMGIDIAKRLFVSDRATLVSPFHHILDRAEEYRKRNGHIGIVGTTGRGIGPAYADSRSRIACKVGDIFTPGFEEDLCLFHLELLEWYQKTYGFSLSDFDVDRIKRDWMESVLRMKELQICDMTEKVQDLISSGKRILAEGAQGVMLDVDHGDYPNVTSSTTLPGGVCSGLGIPHTLIGDVVGILKLYPTKVGGGAFPSQFHPQELEDLWRNAGHEYGATTGRARMCGMLDLPALKYAMHLSGANKLFIAKADICPTEDFLIATDYLCNGEEIKSFPRQLKKVDGVKTLEIKGWPEIKPGIKDAALLPEGLTDLLEFLESQFKEWGFNASIGWIGTGPDRADVVHLIN